MNDMRMQQWVDQAAPRADGHAGLRLLLPIDGSDRSRWAIQYVRSRARRGERFEVELLFVAEPIQNWQVLRFRTRKEISRFQAERGRFLLEDAVRQLQDAAIVARPNFREGDAAFQILDAAEALGCREIVLPAPETGWLGGAGRDVAAEIRDRGQAARLVTVGADGVPRAAAQA